MGEYKSGTLHSGSKSGPKVTSRKQAVAIYLSEKRKEGGTMPAKKDMAAHLNGMKKAGKLKTKAK